MINQEIYDKAKKINAQKEKKNEDWHKQRDYEIACLDAGICEICGGKIKEYYKWRWKEPILPGRYFVIECLECDNYWESDNKLLSRGEGLDL